MVLTWCKVLVRAIGGHFRREARPEPPRSWRGEPLAAVAEPAPNADPYRTVSTICISDGPAHGPAAGSLPIPPAPAFATPVPLRNRLALVRPDSRPEDGGPEAGSRPGPFPW
jgi:hypothetical protein